MSAKEIKHEGLHLTKVWERIRKRGSALPLLRIFTGKAIRKVFKFGHGGHIPVLVPNIKNPHDTVQLRALELDLRSAVKLASENIIIVKQYASAFFGTPLAATLTSLGVDTILLTGCSTSGCVRASAVDGMQHGFRVIVPRECVGDRHQGPHEANLFDINSKYGDVVSKNEVMEYLQKL